MRRLHIALPVVLVLTSACSGTQAKTSSAVSGDSSKHGASVARASAEPIDYTPPAISTLKDDAMGRSVRRGLALVMHTHDSLPEYAPGNITCSNCHLDAGLRRDAAPMAGSYARYPKFLDRSGAVVQIEDRVNYCFTRSLAGKRIPNESSEMRDIVAYLAFISRGVPVGAHVKGESMPRMPVLSGDSARGHRIFTSTCAVCHGADGQGTPPTIPALWGPRSFAIGASMAREERAASFIRHFMPLTNPGSLTDQQAFDVASYIDAMPRPDSPAKEQDWPAGGAPADVPYDTRGHAAHRPPAHLYRRSAEGATVPAPVSVRTSDRVSLRTSESASPGSPIRS